MAAVTAEHQVANLALGLCGQRQLLNSLAENSVEAELARAYLASTRNELLEAWEWRFARKAGALALTAETRPSWAYAYRAPVGMLKPRRIYNGQRVDGRGDRIPFDWELNDAGDGHLILTDQQDARLIWTAEVTTVALWPPLFVKAVAAQLAVYMAASIPLKPELSLALESRARLALQQAAAADANSAQADEETDAESIRVR